MAVKPITGVCNHWLPPQPIEDENSIDGWLTCVQMLRRGLVTDLSIALGIGFAMGSAFWHGYHMPRTLKRDEFYTKLEQEKAAARGQ